MSASTASWTYCLPADMRRAGNHNSGRIGLEVCPYDVENRHAGRDYIVENWWLIVPPPKGMFAYTARLGGWHAIIVCRACG